VRKRPVKRPGRYAVEKASPPFRNATACQLGNAQSRPVQFRQPCPEEWLTTGRCRPATVRLTEGQIRAARRFYPPQCARV